MKLQRIFHGMKDAARVRNKLLFDTFNQQGLTEMETAPFLFVKRGMIIVCYVHDLFLFAEKESLAEDIKQKLGSTF